jgi:hypothetical protein
MMIVGWIQRADQSLRLWYTGICKMTPLTRSSYSAICWPVAKIQLDLKWDAIDEISFYCLNIGDPNYLYNV